MVGKLSFVLHHIGHVAKVWLVLGTNADFLDIVDLHVRVLERKDICRTVKVLFELVYRQIVSQCTQKCGFLEVTCVKDLDFLDVLILVKGSRTNASRYLVKAKCSS